jgi:hypothetical protein
MAHLLLQVIVAKLQALQAGGCGERCTFQPAPPRTEDPLLTSVTGMVVERHARLPLRRHIEAIGRASGPV